MGKLNRLWLATAALTGILWPVLTTAEIQPEPLARHEGVTVR